jgi:hypothetical protein
LGVGVSNLFHRDDPEQYRLFESGRKKAERSVQAMDRIWEKFGPEAIKRATLLDKKNNDSPQRSQSTQRERQKME